MCRVVAAWAQAARGTSGGSDRLVYQDQLLEIERDRAAGLIGGAEAESARVEISRRLLAAADAESIGGGFAVGAAICLPPPRRGRRGRHYIAGDRARLLSDGSVRRKFRANRRLPASSTPIGAQSIASLIGQVEAHLASNPNDGAGWEVIAPVYMRLGRFDDAAGGMAQDDRAQRRQRDARSPRSARRWSPPRMASSPMRRLTAFQHAVAADPHEPKASYFLGLADEQAGKHDDAAAKWRALLDGAPHDAPWAGFVRARLWPVSVGGAGGVRRCNGPSAGDVAASENLNDTQRSEMVRGMVQRLADRLHSDGGNVDEWLRLVQAYIVLGDRDKAKDAVADAKRALSDHPDEIKRIDDLVKGLGA